VKYIEHGKLKLKERLNMVRIRVENLRSSETREYLFDKENIERLFQKKDTRPLYKFLKKKGLSMDPDAHFFLVDSRSGE